MSSPIAVFTAEERRELREQLLETAALDARITGAAITGSGAVDTEDRWSDVDLAFGVSCHADLTTVLADWTALLYGQYRAVHHVDVIAGAWTYRVFLLANSLQVDLAFVEETHFRALAPTFRLVSGKANPPVQGPPLAAGWTIGMAWLYALHARSCIERGKPWQAEYMISGARDHALTLACIRLGLATAHGRGFDQLPPEVTAAFAGTLVTALDDTELRRAFRAVMDRLIAEIHSADPDLSERAKDALGLLRGLLNDPAR